MALTNTSLRALLLGLRLNSWNGSSGLITASYTAGPVCIDCLKSTKQLTQSAELKELIAMHSNMGHYGGDLKNDTVTIIGATLDLQEKVVSQVIAATAYFTFTLTKSKGNDSNQRRLHVIYRYQTRL